MCREIKVITSPLKTLIVRTAHTSFYEIRRAAAGTTTSAVMILYAPHAKKHRA